MAGMERVCLLVGWQIARDYRVDCYISTPYFVQDHDSWLSFPTLKDFDYILINHQH